MRILKNIFKGDYWRNLFASYSYVLFAACPFNFEVLIDDKIWINHFNEKDQSFLFIEGPYKEIDSIERKLESEECRPQFKLSRQKENRSLLIVLEKGSRFLVRRGEDASLRFISKKTDLLIAKKKREPINVKSLISKLNFLVPERIYLESQKSRELVLSYWRNNVSSVSKTVPSLRTEYRSIPIFKQTTLKSPEKQKKTSIYETSFSLNRFEINESSSSGMRAIKEPRIAQQALKTPISLKSGLFPGIVIPKSKDTPKQIIASYQSKNFNPAYEVIRKSSKPRPVLKSNSVFLSSPWPLLNAPLKSRKIGLIEESAASFYRTNRFLKLRERAEAPKIKLFNMEQRHNGELIEISFIPQISSSKILVQTKWPIAFQIEDLEGNRIRIKLEFCDIKRKILSLPLDTSFFNTDVAYIFSQVKSKNTYIYINLREESDYRIEKSSNLLEIIFGENSI